MSSDVFCRVKVADSLNSQGSVSVTSEEVASTSNVSVNDPAVSKRFDFFSLCFSYISGLNVQIF